MLKASVLLISAPNPSDSERSRLRCMVVGHKYVIGPGSYRFGRGDEMYHQITDGYLSRSHFQIDVDEQSMYLTDLGSKHGTFLERGGEKKLEVTGRLQLQSGDCIHAGRSIFRVELHRGLEETDVTPPPGRANSTENPVFVGTASAVSAPTSSVSRPTNTSSPSFTPPAQSQEEPNFADQLRGMGSADSFTGLSYPDLNFNNYQSPSSSDVESKSDADPSPPGWKNFEELAAEPKVSRESQSGDQQRDSSLFSPLSWPLASPTSEKADNSHSAEIIEPEKHPPLKPAKKQPIAEPFTTDIESNAPTGYPTATNNQAWLIQHVGAMDFGQIWKTVRALEERISLFAVVHFAKIGQYTPTELAACEPLIEWLPAPISVAYGPILVKAEFLRKALVADTFQSLCESQALSFLGSSDERDLKRSIVSKVAKNAGGSGSICRASLIDQDCFLSTLRYVPFGQLVPALGKELCFLYPENTQFGVEWVLQSSTNRLRIS